MFPKPTQMPSTKTIVSAAASAAATATLIRNICRDFLPHELRDYIYSQFKILITTFSSELTIVMEEYEGLNHNHLFKAAEVYLEPTIPPSAKRIKATQVRNARNITLSLEKNEEIIDYFNGVQLKWKFVSKQVPSKNIPSPDRYSHTIKSELRSFELSFHKKHKEMVVETYLPHVLNKAKELKEKNKILQLHTSSQDRMVGHGGGSWQSVIFDHPATFETLAMDLELKSMIMEDLERFVKRKEYYRRVGKAWKRGYLLFGPPGTGKSSLIAAMADYLNFDIYDLELTELRGNNELRRLLISTGNKSILVVEDIDCTIELQNRLAEARAMNPNRHHHGFNSASSEVTLSGLLNFIDGLWSSCEDERIIVFTTSHKDRLDPALLRPGRMDMHIHMCYCTPCGFKMLASNYLGITEPSLYSEIEELIVTTKVTPAEVGGRLMKDEVPETVLGGRIEFLEGKKKESEESKASKEELEAAEEAESTQEIEEKGGNEKQVGKKRKEH